jgi:hypothetical protein
MSVFKEYCIQIADGTAWRVNMQNVGNAAPGTVEAGSKKSLKERALSELEKYAVITLYLWLLFALFSLHRQLVLGHGVSVWHQGLAIVNALIFGKVIFVVLGKSLIFAILLLAFPPRKRFGPGSWVNRCRLASPISAAHCPPS